jgi:glutamyl-tRNA reductase
LSQSDLNAPFPGEPQLLLVGTDFRCSELELRERVAYASSQAEALLVRLLARSPVSEAFLLSTCNRTEVLVQPREEKAAYRTALDLVFLERAPELACPGRLYVKRNGDALRHVFAVASGLESMVLGEPEILGQVREAAALAETVGASGPVLKKLLRCAMAAGGRVRQETAISTGAVSLGYAVVELAKNIFTSLSAMRVLLLGAGEVSRGVARNLCERGAASLRVCNRGDERAQQFLDEFPDVQRVPWQDRLAALAETDLLVASTGADEPVISRKELSEAMRGRPGRPLLIVDLGVPRNVPADAGRMENVFLHPLDSLEHLIQRNLLRRRNELPHAEEILERELSLFRAWYRSMAAEPLIAQIQKQAERIRAQEVAQALPRFPPALHDDLDRLTRALVRKILHHPSSRLRGGDREELSRLELVRELFRLDEEEGGD